MLATKISFINEMANLCETLAEDGRFAAGRLRRQADRSAFMFPGIGYGGSCFPRIARADPYGETHGLNCRLLRAGRSQPAPAGQDVRTDKGVSGRRSRLEGCCGVGAAYKAGTNDVRRSPSIVIVKGLLRRAPASACTTPGPRIGAGELGDSVVYCDDCYDA